MKSVTKTYPWARARNRAGLAVCAAAAAWMLVRTRPFRVAVEGESMSPELEAGDFLVATRSGCPSRGSLVVVRHPARPGYQMVKRLVGLPGDLIDGRRIDLGERWVLGDNPAGSTDSRHFGAVGAGALLGLVRLRYWPPSRIKVF